MSVQPPTEEEVQKLKEFRQRVEKIYPERDEKLIPWLRARELDVNKAEQMLRRHLIWRKNNEIASLSTWKSPKVFFPYLHCGNDKEGAPVYIMPIGRWEMRSSVEAGDIVPSLRFIYQTLENLVTSGNARGIYQGIVICDFDGFGYRQIAHRTVLQGILEVLRIFEANYPEVLKAAFVVNAPKVFNYLFALVKPLLNSRTLAKVQIYGPNKSKWQEMLLKLIDSDQLPPYWGGTKPGRDEFCSDDWFMEPLAPNFLKKSASSYDEFGDEWITMKVAAGEKVIFEYHVTGKGDAALRWAFTTESYDIGFAIYYGDADEYLVKYSRVNSHEEKEEGILHLDKPGQYTLMFDNSYSRARSKTLHYSVCFTELEREEDFHDLDSQQDENENNTKM